MDDGTYCIKFKKRELKKWRLGAFVIMVLFLPQDILRLTSIYHSGTSQLITYVWLDFYFSYLYIPFIICGIIAYFKNQCVKFFPVLMCLFIWNCLRYFLGYSNVFEHNQYEMFLSLLTGFCMCSLICRIFNNSVKLREFIEFFMIANFLSQFFSFVIEHGVENRYSAWGQDVGTTGLFYAFYLILWLCLDNRNKKLSIVALASSSIGILLSGSRASLLMVGFYYTIYFLFKYKKVITSYKAMSFIIAVSILFFCFNLLKVKLMFQSLERFTQLFSSTDFLVRVISDNSTAGRIASLNAGFLVLKNNWLGVSNGFLDLQSNMNLYGYPTFPHSYLLSHYLLWGPIALVCFAYILLLLKKMIKLGSAKKWLCLFLVIVFMIYGGAIVNPKIYFFYFLLLSYLKMTIREKEHGLNDK